MLRYWLFQAHWLVGITAGIVLAIVGATGALLSFETEIVAWLNRDSRIVERGTDTALSPPDLIQRVRVAAPDRRIQSVTLQARDVDAVRVSFAAPTASAATPGSSRPPRESEGRGRPRGESRYVDPYTGQLIDGRGNKGEQFFRDTRSLHRWLMIGAWGDQAIGRQIVGACTVILIGLALSGLYLRWPRGRATRWRAWLMLNPRLRGRAFLWNLHAVTGTWVLLLYLFMALTGLYWSYDWYRERLAVLTGATPPAARSAPGAGSDERASDDDGTWSHEQLTRAWENFRQQVGPRGYVTASLELPSRPTDELEIRYLPPEAPHPRALDTVKLRGSNGAVSSHVRYDDKKAGDRFMGSIFPLHSGRYFGLPGVILFMAASLAMPLFAITGWMLYLKRRRLAVSARWSVASAE